MIVRVYCDARPRRVGKVPLDCAAATASVNKVATNVCYLVIGHALNYFSRLTLHHVAQALPTT